ncbi:MAG TPA: Gfo/Idh/MocA family oxidoreductase [Firmicutes bacterium]|nr:Gfo/Idh/MocA family oxidoreductase [Bacillota bacterium]
MVKIGFLSIAHMHAFSYANALKKMPHAKLAGLYDPNEQRGRDGASKMGVKYFSEPAELLEQVDAVIVCSENSRHREFTELAASFGRHVLSEKPIATSLKDGAAMIDACQEAGVKLQIAFPVRFNTPARRLKELLADGAVGEILAIRGTNQGKMPGGWFIDPELAGGGAVLDHTVHVVDLLRWFLGREFISVYAEIDNFLPGVEIDDSGLLSMEMEGGIFVTQDPSWSKPEIYPTWGNVTLKVVGTAGVLYMDAFSQNFLLYDNKAAQIVQRSFTEDMDYLLIEDFVDMILADKEPSITGYDGLAALAVAKAAYESARLQRPISVAALMKEFSI